MTENEKLDLILKKIDTLDTNMSDMKNEISDMKNEMADMKSSITNIELVLENEIRVNIQRVAEGHLDLSRNLHDAMKPSNEIEMLAIKVRMLETDVRDLKARLT